MNKPLLALVLLLSSTATAATPYIGESVIYTDDSHSYVAIVSNIIDSDEVDLIVLADDTFWSPGSTTLTAEAAPVWYIGDVVRGSGDGQWLENPAMYVGSKITGDSAGSISLNGGGARLSTTRDVELTVSVQVALPLTVLAGAQGTVHLFCDANSTPTTEVVTLTRGNTGGILTTDTSTLLLRYRVATNDYCSVTTSADVGSPTFSIIRQRVQVVD